MIEVGLANVTARPLTVAYHSACSMQHGQKVIEQPKKLLRDAGFVVKDVPEGHLCCGWAGTYQVLQPELSRRLRDRKVANIESVQARRDRRRAISAASATSRRAPAFRLPIPSSCSTGRPAGRSRRRCR